MKNSFSKNILTICSIAMLLFVLTMWSVYVNSFVHPYLNNVFVQMVFTVVVYIGSICMFASMYFIPQAIFAVCVGLVMFVAIRLWKLGKIGTTRFAVLCLMNGISVCLMLVYSLLLVGVFG